jgi:predicted nucleic acid-binding protein
MASIGRLLAAGESVCFTSQTIAEFWNVATRPAERNGLGFSLDATLAEVNVIEQTLALLEDSVAIYKEWRRLVVRHRVLGVKVHDTRLVAAMNVHGVGRILTFNTSDFARFAVEAVHPAALVG